MPEEITDLDELAGPNKKVTLTGDDDQKREYVLPGDLPIETFLHITSLEQRIEDDDVEEADLIVEIRDKLLDLFRIHQPKFEFPQRTGIKTISRMIGRIYRGVPADGVEEADGTKDGAEVADPERPRGKKRTPRSRPSSNGSSTRTKQKTSRKSASSS